MDLERLLSLLGMDSHVRLQEGGGCAPPENSGWELGLTGGLMESTEVAVLRTTRLDDEHELWFCSYSLGKRRLGSARIYKDTSTYSGPTKSGIDMGEDKLAQLIPLLRTLSVDLDTGRCVPPCEYASIESGDNARWLVQVLVHETRPDLFLVDVRKFISGEKYTGPTRKGIRLAVDHIDALADGLEAVRLSLHEWRQGLSGLFAAEGSASAASVADPTDTQGAIPDHLKDYF
ncbi:MAG: hypothetical protein ACYC77_08725 [Coriobacteriia bacterium]